MKKVFQSDVLAIGLAIFSMFFGAGNLMYPIKVGIDSGDKIIFGMSGFLITAIILPLLGLLAMILFEGDYKAFFFRLGEIPGKLILLICILIVGPLIAIPRIVTLSYTMMSPFIPNISLVIFTALFLGLTFICTYRESKIVNLLGKYISPALLVSLSIIIIKGFLTGTNMIQTSITPFNAFKENFWRGYETLDLLGAIFFSSVVLHILKKVYIGADSKKLAFVGFQAGVIGISLLALVYIGMSNLGLYHGLGLEGINSGELFREVSFRVLGVYGAAIIATAVIMACLSTAIALAVVVAEFAQVDLFKNKINYAHSLIIVLLSCVPLSLYGLDAVLKLTGGVITYVGYPILITLTLLNIAYKLFNFKPVKLPVLIVGTLALISYFL
ncbi:MAG: branched-chain amino acid transport system II carrier protein [Candidatus Babeliales bacterium]|nr:branched-chain amino acid transport system II carrier protein [Candidatus Babeliales bacterium]